MNVHQRSRYFPPRRPRMCLEFCPACKRICLLEEDHFPNPAIKDYMHHGDTHLPPINAHRCGFHWWTGKSHIGEYYGEQERRQSAERKRQSEETCKETRKAIDKERTGNPRTRISRPACFRNHKHGTETFRGKGPR